MGEKHLVILVHGIRHIARWQSEVANSLRKEGSMVIQALAEREAQACEHQDMALPNERTHPTHERLITLGLTGMAKALEQQRRQSDQPALPSPSALRTHSRR